MTNLNVTLLETKDALVRIMNLDSGEATAWHYHTEVTDRMICIEGRIAIESIDPDEVIELDMGAYCTVEVERVHRVVNLAEGKSRYLLVQGVGHYDFNVVEEDLLNAAGRKGFQDRSP